MSNLPKPYYEQDGITIYHADCREILPHLDPVDLVLTDPPYTDLVHAGSVTGDRGGGSIRIARELIDFAPISDEDLHAILETCGNLCSRWIVSTLAWQQAAMIERNPPEGLRFVRLGVWVKTNSQPQLTGDRPGQGWEAIAMLHRTGGTMRWNGKGKAAVYTHNIERGYDQGLHPAQKPRTLMRELVSLFSDTGDVVLDPFMGSGTTLRAAKDLGRRAIGVELSEQHCETAVKRLQQSVLPLGDVA